MTNALQISSTIIRADGCRRCSEEQHEREANAQEILGASIAASRLFPGKIMNSCTHRGAMRDVQPKSSGCEDCLKQGDSWVQLRMCLTCGNVGCCDSSKNKHATAHFDASGHPVMRSLHPGDSWKWCYVDRVMLE